MRELAVDRSLWLDEALLAGNIVERSWRGLLEPLDGQQGAPVGFLWLERAIYLVAGPDEAWLRAPSLVAGVLVMVLVWRIGRRLSPRTAAIAVVLVALTPGLVRYSAELKQYQLDVLLVLTVLLLLARVIEVPSTGRRAALTVGGAVVLWFSHPVLLALAGAGLLLTVRWTRGSQDHHLRQLATIALGWMISLGLLTSASALGELSSNQFLDSYWAEGYPGSLRPDRLMEWFVRATSDLFEAPGGFALAPIVLLSALAGAIALGVNGRASALGLLLSFAPPVVIAAAVEAYPYKGRLALGVLPIALLLVAAATDAPKRLRWVSSALVLVVVADAGFASWHNAAEPTLTTQGREATWFVAEHRRSTDRVVVHNATQAPFGFYGPQYGLVADLLTYWHPAGDCQDDPLPLEGRVWLVYAHTLSQHPEDEAEILRTHLATQARLETLAEFHDAFAALYDFDAPPDDPTGAHRRRSPATGCLAALPGDAL